MFEIFTQYEDDAWSQQNIDIESRIGEIRGALEQALAGLPQTGEVCCVLSNDDQVARLNEKFRHKAGPTNVLSFPSSLNLPGPATDTVLGDIILARETIEREAEEQGKSLNDHLSHLLVHGLLHLLGYDHETDREAEAMESKEIEILRTMGIANPYDVRQPAMEKAR